VRRVVARRVVERRSVVERRRAVVSAQLVAKAAQGSRWAGGSGFVPVTLDFGVRFPNEKNQGKHAHHVFKYLVAQRVPTPRAQLCPRSCRNKHTREIEIEIGR
jgi:hypothetical protein